jgi:hypothetical protein
MFGKKGSPSITIPVHKNSVKIDYLKIIAGALELSAEEPLEPKEKFEIENPLGSSSRSKHEDFQSRKEKKKK